MLKIKLIYIIFVYVIIFFICVNESYARRGWQGCCSWHGGVSYQCVNGHMLCNDGTLSPTCLCDNGDKLLNEAIDNFNNLMNRGSYRGQQWHVVDDSKFSFSENKDIRNILVQEGRKSLSFSISNKRKNDICLSVTIGNNIYFIDNFKIETNLYLKNKNINLAYSIDGSKYKKCKVIKVEDLYYTIRIEFIPDEIEHFFEGCIAGNKIRFFIENENVNKYIDVSLIGFTSAYNSALSLLK